MTILDHALDTEGIDPCWVEQRRPISSGSYAKDCALGRQYADHAISMFRDSRNPATLGQIIKGMVNRGVWGGLEIGFFHRISEHLIAADTPCRTAQTAKHDQMG